MRAYPIEVRRAILAALDDGLGPREVGRRFGVGVSSVKRYRQRHQQGDSLAPRQSPGRPPRIRGDDPRLVAQVAAYPGATLAEHCTRWQEQTGCHVSTTTMSRVLIAAGCPRQPKPRMVRPPVSKPHTEAPSPASSSSRSLPMSSDRQRYPTDLTDAEWAVLEPLIPPPKTGGRPARS